MHQLILAIEPDRRQSAKLAVLARNQLQAEMVIVDSVHEALNTLDHRVPHLLLVSPLVRARDEAALAARVRELEANGAKVGSLIIPLLEAPIRRVIGPHKGAPARIVPPRGPRGQDVCDPTAFAMQLARLLDRIAGEPPRVVAVPPPRRQSEFASPVVEEAAEDVEADTTPTPAASAQTPELSDVLAALQRALDRLKLEHLEPEKPVMITQPASPTVAGPSPVASLPPILESKAPAVESVQAVPAVAAPTSAPGRRKKRPKSPPPAQDEWGFFDPEQCGLAALRNKLDEISGSGTKKPG